MSSMVDSRVARAAMAIVWLTSCASVVKSANISATETSAAPVEARQLQADYPIYPTGLALAGRAEAVIVAVAETVGPAVLRELAVDSFARLSLQLWGATAYKFPLIKTRELQHRSVAPPPSREAGPTRGRRARPLLGIVVLVRPPSALRLAS